MEGFPHIHIRKEVDKMPDLKFVEIRFMDIYMQIPKDVEAIETAKMLLDKLKEKIEKESQNN